MFIYLFIFGCLGPLLLRAGFSLAVASRGYSSLRCVGFSLRWLLLLRSTGSRRTGFSSCGAGGLSCSVACGIFLDQGLNPCPLHWQADSYNHCATREAPMASFNLYPFAAVNREHDSFAEFWDPSRELLKHSGHQQMSAQKGVSCRFLGALCVGAPRARLHFKHLILILAQRGCAWPDVTQPGVGAVSDPLVPSRVSLLTLEEKVSPVTTSRKMIHFPTSSLFMKLLPAPCRPHPAAHPGGRTIFPEFRLRVSTSP